MHLYCSFIPKKLALALLILASLFMTSCSGENGAVELKKSWKISYSDSIEYKEPDFDDSSWKSVNLPGKISTKEKKQYIWLRKEVVIPEKFRGKDISIYLAKIWDTDSTYFNGNKIGTTGKEYPKFTSAWNFDRNYYIPDSLIKYGEKNVIAVRIFSNLRTVVKGGPFIAEKSKVDIYYFAQKCFNQYIPLSAGAVTLFLSILSLITYLLERRNRLHLHYAGISFLWFILTFHYYFPEFGISYNVHDILYYSILAIEVAWIYIFLENLLNVNHRIMRRIILIMCLSALIICVTATENDPITGWRMQVYGAIGALSQVFWLVSIIQALKANHKEAKIILVGYIIFAITLIHDAFAINHIINTSFWMNMGYPAFITSFGAILATRTVRLALDLESAKYEIEDYAKNLENKVEERTKQLKEANLEIESSMKELEKLNTNLVEVNSSLEEAQRIASIDMQMATSVQLSFFPKKPPVTDEWEIAFLFRPMMGVSGDLYDFYMENNRLAGISLFDVSGHGIASGLLTMLARSIIHREFYLRKEEKLNTLISNINSSIITEMGNADHYLTGILLRFKNSHVEYVNAGHTQLLYKRGENGAVRIVEPRGREFNGHFLGVEAMKSKFDQITFKMDKNDIIMLYSDCLIEGSNQDDEEFGMERVEKSLASIPSGLSAQEVLDRVISDFTAHTEGAKQNDDLTVIVARRLL